MEQTSIESNPAVSYAVGLLEGSVVARGAVVALQPRALEICMALAAHGGSMANCALVDLLYPELDDLAAHTRLRVYICRLRRTLPGIVETGRHGGYALSRGVRIDLDEIESWVYDPQGAVPGPSNVAAVLPVLKMLLAPRDGAPFDRWSWYGAVETRITEVTSSLMTMLACVGLPERHAEEAIAVARLGIARDPYDESARRLMIASLLTARRDVSALRAYEEYRRLLRTELNVEAPADLRSLLSAL